jgi:dipeptidyl aminopeptidase/acylaminoacyl peptidase
MLPPDILEAHMNSSRTALHRLTLALAAVLLVATAATAQNVLTPEIILSLRNAENAQISPDGRWVAFHVAGHGQAAAQPDRPARLMREIWLAPAAGGEARPFTRGPAGDSSPAWSPDGGTLAFLSQRPGSEFVQIQLMAAAGGEARPLTKAPSAVEQFRWSPDGKRIAFTFTDPKTQAEREAEKQGRDWTVADRNYKHIRLHVVEVATGEVSVVTKEDITVHDFDWSPDGQRLVIAAAPTPTIDDSFMKLSVRIVPAAGGESRLVVNTEGKLSAPRWSPDGRWIAWLGAIQRNDPFAGSVFVVAASGGEARNLTEGYEGTATSLIWRPGYPASLVFGAIERQNTAVHSLAVPDGKRTTLYSGPLILLGTASFSRDGKMMAAVASTPQHPNEVFAGPAGGALARLTTLNPQLEGVQLGEQEIVRWKAADGWDIEGVLVKPVGFRAGTRYPVILQAHGGPEAADLNGWLGSFSRWGQMLAGMGYAVFYPNYRGSIGRGPKFAMGDHRDLMGKEFTDMTSGLDHLVKLGIADAERQGVGGGSYGGYTTAWAVTWDSARFKGGVMWMGISNWISMTGTSDIFEENSTVHWDLVMYDNYEMYWERSPLKHIHKAQTPTLIVHGAVDPRVPIGQSQEMYTALKWKGVPVDFVTYPRQGHGITEKEHQRDFMQRVAAWFDKYVKGAKAGTD